MPTITFRYADRKLSLRNKASLKSFLIQLFEKEKRPLEQLTYIFCSDDYLLSINQSFLNHDDYTDIITFDLSEGREITGEIYISLDRVKENSLTHNTRYADECLRVIFHGALHLCGFKDKLIEDIKQMRNKEDQYIRLYWQQNP